MGVCGARICQVCVFCGSLVSEGKMVRAPSRMPTLTTMKPSRRWDTQVVKIWATRPTNQGNEVNLYSDVTLFAKFLGWSTSQPRWTAMW
jgi:hypothetical protein